MAYSAEQQATMRRLCKGILTDEETAKMEFYFLIGSGSNNVLNLTAATGLQHLMRKVERHYQQKAAEEAGE